MMKPFFILLALAACVIGAAMAYTRPLTVELPASIPSIHDAGADQGQGGALAYRCRHRRC
ncbi:MAG: hypothetical protein ACHQZQ_08835 [SAR324 cluster bacterium]